MNELGKKNSRGWARRFMPLWIVSGIAGLTAIVLTLWWITIIGICACSPSPSQEFLHVEMIHKVLDAHNVDQSYQFYDEM